MKIANFGCEHVNLGILKIIIVIGILTLLLITGLHAEGRNVISFPAVMGPCGFVFPKDHGAHPDYRTEWWYYTGNLQSADGRRFGFQLTFFRNRLIPPGREASWPKSPSAWRTAQVFLAHAAVTDIQEKRHYDDERTTRLALEMAGAEQFDGKTRVFLHDWSAHIQDGVHRLKAAASGFSMDLTLFESKPAAFHGDNGYSRKGSDPGRASCYYSLTRLASEGKVGIAGKMYPVSGTAWMDHEYGSETLEPGIAGWDWFSLQLSDGTEIMIYLLRKKEGGNHPVSGGSRIDGTGVVTPLAEKDIQVTVLNTWKSPQTSTNYPVGWRIRIPAHHMDFHVKADVEDQELQTNSSTRVTYWEGSVTVSGESEGIPVTGAGYVELTGYDKPMEAPL